MFTYRTLLSKYCFVLLCLLSFGYSAALAQNNLVVDGEFDDGTSAWTQDGTASEGFTLTQVSGAGLSGEHALLVNIDSTGADTWDNALYQTVAVEAGKRYQVSFIAKAEADKTINFQIKLEQGGSLLWETLALSTDSQVFNYSYNAKQSGNVRIMYHVGGTTDNVFLDAIQMLDETSVEARPGENPVVNGDFETGTDPWTVHRVDGVSHTIEAVADATTPGNQVMKATISEGGADPWSLVLFTNPIAITEKIAYTFSFRAKAAAVKTINVQLLLNGANAAWETINLTDEFQEFTLPKAGGQPGLLRAAFHIGGSNEDVYLDDVAIEISLEDTDTGLVANGEFNEGTEHWTPSPADESAFSIRSVSGRGLGGENALLATITQAAPDPADQRILSDPIAVQQGYTYDLEFLARATAERPLTLEVLDNGQSALRQPLELTDANQRFTYSFTAQRSGTARLVFHVGGAAEAVLLDAISMRWNGEKPNIILDNGQDLTPLWDSTTVLRNPDKGWYHHYIDNSPAKYLGEVADVTAVPGLDHLLIRLSWRHFEPADDEYDWSWIDEAASTYVPLGYKIALAITTKETVETYATPEWVLEAGAQGQIVNAWGSPVWEPDYGDPIFLEKLEEFHAAVAARYAGQPWLSYVQVASYGTWGEGHNHPASDKVSPNSVIQQHIDMYEEHYSGVRICVPKSVYANSANRTEMRDYVESRGMFWTDHSIFVNYHLQTYPATYSISAPELFEGTWKTRPTQLELQHYDQVLRENNWSVPNGAANGADLLRNAIALSHASYVGYHGYADRWLADNPDIARELANKIGYWYFPKSMAMADTLRAGTTDTLTLLWENHGVAPAYSRYNLKLKLENADGSHEQYLVESDNRAWMPVIGTVEEYAVIPPGTLPEGSYQVKIGMWEEKANEKNAVQLALDPSVRDAEGYYTIGEVWVAAGNNASPVVQTTVEPSSGIVPLTISASMTATDADGSPAGYTWYFGEGSTATGSDANFTYPTVGDYTVVARAADEAGGQGEASFLVQGRARESSIDFAPRASFTLSANEGPVPLTIAVDASASGDIETDSLIYQWDSGDGQSEAAPLASFTYPRSGFYRIELTVSDGISTDQADEVIKAGAIPPLSGTPMGTPGSFNDSDATFDKALDGDISTFFDAADDSVNWVGLDLGQPTVISAVGYYPRENFPNRLLGGVFQGANQADFSDAEALYTITDLPVRQRYGYGIVSSDQSYRYVRYLAPEGGYGNIAEAQFYHVAPQIKPLNLTSVCSDDPDRARAWRVTNPNDVAVEIQWQVSGTTQQGRLMATPGRSHFTTRTVGGANTTVIRWTDAEGHTCQRVKASGGQACEATPYSTTTDEIKLYPVPVEDYLEVHYTADNERVEVVVTDLSGRVVATQTIEASAQKRGATRIDLRHLKGGVYLVKLTGRRGSEARTVLVE